MKFLKNCIVLMFLAIILWVFIENYDLNLFGKQVVEKVKHLVELINNYVREQL